MSVIKALGVCRFDEVGELGSGNPFGVNGLASTAIPGFPYADPRAIAIDNNKKIVVGGVTATKPPGTRGNRAVLSLARYRATGQLDRRKNLMGTAEIGTLGDDGVFFTDLRSSSFEAATCLQLKGTSVYLAGEAQPAGSRGKVVAIAKYGEATGPRGTFGLDKSFGGDGVVLTDFSSRKNERAIAITVDSGRRIWVAAETQDETFTQRIGLVCYRHTGQLDERVDGDGKVLLERNTRPSDIIALRNKVLVAGQKTGRWIIYKLRPEGKPDTTFGANGTVGLTLTGGWRARSCAAIRIDRSGRIVAAGTAHKGKDRRFVVARYKSSGTLDTTFGTNGFTLVDFKSATDEAATGLAIDRADRIAVCGKAFHTSEKIERAAVFRLTERGELDKSFSDDGKAYGPLEMSGASGIATDDRNRIVISAAVEAERLIYGETQTGFIPSLHGLRYENVSLHQEVKTLGGGHLYVGMTACGGMALTARDYFTFNRVAPDRTRAPGEKEAFRYWVFQRQLDSLGWKGKLPTDRPFRSALRAINPLKAALPWRREYKQWHNHDDDADLLGWSFGHLMRLSQVVNAQKKPALIGLVYKDANNLFDHHQVLAIGMSGAEIGTPAKRRELINNRSKSRLLFIHVYDPNYPSNDNRCVLVKLRVIRVGHTGSSSGLQKELTTAWMTSVRLGGSRGFDPKEVARAMELPKREQDMTSEQKALHDRFKGKKKDMRGMFLMSPSGFDNRPDAPPKDPGSKLS